MKFLRDLFTTVDNTHYEIARVAFAISVLSAIGYQGWAIHAGQTYDPLQFASGLATIVAAGGFGIAAKDKARKADQSSEV